MHIFFLLDEENTEKTKKIVEKMGVDNAENEPDVRVRNINGTSTSSVQ